MKTRPKRIAVFVLASVVLTLLALSGEEKPDFSITGYAVYEDQPIYNYYKSQVIVHGMEFEVAVDSRTYYYIYAEDGWYESKEDFVWEKRDDMGNTLWSGLTYLRLYDAKIFFQEREVKDFTDFAKEIR